MPKASKNSARKTPKKTTPPRRLPPWLPPLIAVLAAAVLLLSLISHHSGDTSVWVRGETRPVAAAGYGFGLPGAFLVYAFGLWSFWPIPVLLIYAVSALLKIRLSQSWLVAGLGAVLFFFAASALFDFIWPKLPFLWPDQPGGGAFGSRLADGAKKIAGRVGSYIVLPLLSLIGLLMMTGRPWRVLTAIFEAIRPKVDPAAPRRVVVSPPDSGLKEDPTTPALTHEEPVIVDKKPAEAVPNRAAPPPPRPAVSDGDRPPYRLPETALLDEIPPDQAGHASGLSEAELLENAHLLEAKLRDFGVDGRVLEVSGGPVITMYEYQPAPGIKISKVAGLADDLTMAMRAISIRVVAPLPGKAAIGIEIPNAKRGLVSFREVAESPAFQNSRSPLSLILGVDIMGAPQVADLAKMPHLLIAGATGSGKSVGLGAMIMSILYKASPERVRFMMIDPKCVELALYKDIPHLIYPVLSDPAEATLGLKWAVAEMDLRYKLLAEKGVRNIETYNEKVRAELKTWKRRRDENGAEEEPPKELPFLVIIIDELADLMMVSAKEVEVYITRLAQKARAAGIHLILATQRPSVDVLTGVIKANMPTRISFQVSQRVDSRTILDQMGAEKLLGAGDMLYMPPGIGKLKRLHGAFVSDGEIKNVADFVRAWGPPNYLEDLSLPEAEADEGGGEKDEKYDEAVELVRRTQKASISHIQRHLRIGYNRAARIIEDMEREGLIGPQDGVRPRTILI